MSFHKLDLWVGHTGIVLTFSMTKNQGSYGCTSVFAFEGLRAGATHRNRCTVVDKTLPASERNRADAVATRVQPASSTRETVGGTNQHSAARSSGFRSEIDLLRASVSPWVHWRSVVSRPSKHARHGDQRGEDCGAEPTLPAWQDSAALGPQARPQHTAAPPW
jgi:hypothetical protein